MLVQPGDNPLITKERQAATIDVSSLAAFIHGGANVVKRRHEILQAVEAISELQNTIPIEFLSREERHEEQTRRAVIMSDVATDIIDASDFFGEGIYYQGLVIGHDLHPMSLHYGMVLQAIQNQTDPDQLEEWLGPMVARTIVSTYAQTELGHGTNLSKLETTATYDPKTQEFVLHSPTITATKWWPGGMGKSSNYVLLMAQLITNGTNHGPHPFFIPIRDSVTHTPLPGVKVGDIGPKLGINGNDNGFLRFDHYRVSRRSMLMRNAKVLPDGTYVPPKHAKLGFGAMVFVRSIMVKDQAVMLGAAATIATRYSAIRQQGEITKGKNEVQILEYQTQQYRIFPQIARTLVFLFAANEVKNLYQRVTDDLAAGNLELLPHLHVLSSGLKSVVSWEVALGIEQCRLACGGHGYSLASGLPGIYSYAVGGCTYEGENIVMLLQVARGLVKLVPEILGGSTRHLSELTAYLGQKGSTRTSLPTVGHDFDPQILIRDFESAARSQLFAAYDRLKLNERTLPKEEAWNATGIELCKASRLHVKAYLVKNYFAYVNTCQDASTKKVLTQLGQLYALDQIASAGSYFRRGGYYTDDHLRAVHDGIYRLLALIRPNAVAIVDAFDYSDRELNSVLGRRDGNVYENLLAWAEKSPLNRNDISSAYLKHLKPMIIEGKSKL